MLTELKSARKAVGIKQSRKAVREGNARQAFLAKDADELIVSPIRALCEEKGVPVTEVATMQELGAACGINVGAAVAVLLK